MDSVHCPGMTDTEYRTEFTLWCLMSAPLLVVTDVRNMTSIMKEVLLNKDLIKINQDTTGPGGKRIGFDKTCGEVSINIFDLCCLILHYRMLAKYGQRILPTERKLLHSTML